MRNILEMLKLVMSMLVDLSAVLENKHSLSFSCSVSLFAWTCTVEQDTLWTKIIVLISEVSLFQGRIICIYVKVGLTQVS